MVILRQKEFNSRAMKAARRIFYEKQAIESGVPEFIKKHEFLPFWFLNKQRNPKLVELGKEAWKNKQKAETFAVPEIHRIITSKQNATGFTLNRKKIFKQNNVPDYWHGRWTGSPFREEGRTLILDEIRKSFKNPGPYTPEQNYKRWEELSMVPHSNHYKKKKTTQ